jgi:hypothetical protein
MSREDTGKMSNFNFVRQGPLFTPVHYFDTKDPCPVFDGKIWHIFGSGGSTKKEFWEILHATASSIDGPWIETESAILEGITGPHIAAPGIIFDAVEGLFHMFVQTDFLALDSTVEQLVSLDGHVFKHKGTVLRSIPTTNEAGVYDPHPAEIQGVKYLTYSGFARVGRPDIYLAKSETASWYGPWQRMGILLKHEEVSHHNQHVHEDYEWGLEGSQLVELPSGKILLNAVCFLPEGQRGTRQRVFFAIADKVEGPYYTLGPVLSPQEDDWEGGENGHASALIRDDKFYLFYQSRSKGKNFNNWRYGSATLDVSVLEDAAQDVLRRKDENKKLT